MRFERLEERVPPSGLLDVLSPALLALPLGDASDAGAALQSATALIAPSGRGQKPPKSPPNSNAVSGEAFGVFADLTTLLGLHVALAKTPHVVLPASGGFESATLLTVQAPANGSVLDSGTLHVMTSGAIGPNVASAQSSATVEDLDLLNGLVSAELIVAMSSSTGNGQSASSNAAGSTIIDLSVNGLSLGDITPAPNTTIPIPGVGSVILNEQIAGGNGTTTTSLTVNMIHVALDGLLGKGDIIVSSAHSDVNFTPAAKSGPLFMTGGGRLGEGRDIATFGFNAGARNNGAVQGQLEYIDHAADLNVHSTAINSFSVDGTCVTFSGTARVNGASGYTFTVTEACDNGEPGVGHDTFAIAVNGPGVSYAREGTLTGGNLQLHPA
ncbi:MAG: hypothetical protein HY000_25280 [Planctomycetes bacterium]|nr:hypothetical protein [Planctomycetota bacterium]